MRKWDIYKADVGKKRRGLDEDQVRKWILAGLLTETDFVRPTGQKEWYPVSKARAYFEKVRTEGPEEGLAATRAEVPGEPPADLPPARTLAPTRAEVPPEAEDALAEGPEPLGSFDDEEEGFVRPKPCFEVEEWDLTPMVDMTFLLNMFFIMTTAYALLHSLQIPPPTPQAQAAPKTVSELLEERIMLVIHDDNSIRVDEEEVRLDQLASSLRIRMRDSGKTEIVIAAAGDAHTETLVHVVDAANEVGLRVLLARAEQEY